MSAEISPVVTTLLTTNMISKLQSVWLTEDILHRFYQIWLLSKKSITVFSNFSLFKKDFCTTLESSPKMDFFPPVQKQTWQPTEIQYYCKATTKTLLLDLPAPASGILPSSAWPAPLSLPQLLFSSPPKPSDTTSTSIPSFVHPSNKQCPSFNQALFSATFHSLLLATSSLVPFLVLCWS